MARRKKLLPCGHECSKCVACIQMNEDFKESHALGGQRDACDPRLLLRNLRIKGML